MRLLLRNTVLPVCLMVFCVVTAPLVWFACVAYGGSIRDMLLDWRGLLFSLPPPTLPAAELVLGFAIAQALLLRFLPGKVCQGPVTPSGIQTTYLDNGVLSWAITYVVLVPVVWGFGWIPATAIYDNLGSIVMVCSISSLLFCLVLYVRGPRSADGGRTGNRIFDYFWGVELHPRMFGLDLKRFANCRLGMMSWCAILWSFAARQHFVYHRIASSMWVVVVLQTAYVVKFFFWEGGYLSTLDMMHDHFGFYICWGVTTWLPVVYTSQALYLVNHPRALGPVWTCALLGVGCASIYVNYAADMQRKRVRQTGGRTLIWGRQPELIVARYQTADGRARENLLLASGWWGVSRHFHYLPELTSTLAWTVPCGFQNFLPWFYFLYLAILLTHRSLRDDARCAAKYGPFWVQYRARVPFRIVPGLF